MKKLLFSLFIVIFNSALGQIFPQKEWGKMANPESQGWNIEKVKEAFDYVVDSTHITGLVVVHKGQIVYDYGNTHENSYIASCRKSILAMLYGYYVQEGIINLDKTLEELAIEDVGGLLPIEKKATIRDIIAARSGVFHPASYPGDMLALAPPRGSVKPGSYWLYSNWDFNLAGYLFEKLTQKDIYDEVEKILAIPLGMQDWDRSIQKKSGDTTQSIYKAYPIWFSTRDMARIGLLMLHNGRWNDTLIIDPLWVKEMLTQRTTYKEVNTNGRRTRPAGEDLGYGYMWWLWENQTDSRFKGAYSALGAWGQSITVFPELDLVVAVKTNSMYGRNTGRRLLPALIKIASSLTK